MTPRIPGHVAPPTAADGHRDARSATTNRLLEDGYVILSAEQGAAVLSVDRAQLQTLPASWDDLPRDQYLRDGGRYRSRRHACFIQEFRAGQPPELSRTPQRAHWQPVSYNALHGGLERWFEPIAAPLLATPVWGALLGAIGSLFQQIRGVARWYIEAHQFRIDTAGGIGRPTPEGAHRDGVDFVALLLVRRHHVRGGETRVFDANGTAGVRFTMREPWSMLLLDDARVIHETTPIQPDGADGVRDTLVLTYRSAGFQAPAL
ncbi:MAG TPA: 2OG-Fe dioxygenase family protein [Steroidobacteraceae bacterium]